MPLKKKKADQLAVGDRIQIEGWPRPSGVRSIHIILHMDNNMDVVVKPSDQMYVVP